MPNNLIPLPKPAPFLTVRCHNTDAFPALCGLCVGYEFGKWRAEQFTDHIINWIPEFALSPVECRNFNSGNAMELIRKAARTVYDTDKFKRRGEFGELFLHAAIRQVYDSIPAISKIFYKSATNETVKGFDAVHVVGTPDALELWLGEAKFYTDINAAIRDVAKELSAHLAIDYLRSEFLLIGNKLEDGHPHTPALKRLLAQETSLDEVFKRACVPVLLTYESECVASHTSVSSEYVAAFETEVTSHLANFNKAISQTTVPPDLRIHVFLFPIKQKASLVTLLDQKLKAWQRV